MIFPLFRFFISIAAAWEQHDPSRDFGVAMWDAKTGRSVHRWVYRGSYLRDLTFLDDGKSLDEIQAAKPLSDYASWNWDFITEQSLTETIYRSLTE